MSALKPRVAENGPQKPNYLGLGISYGLIFGAGLSTILSLVLDNPAFIGIGAGLGMCLGVAIGAGLERRAKSEG